MKRVFVEEETRTGDDALGISRAKVAGIIEHARIFDAREANNVRDASNATDDGMISILEDAGDDTEARQAHNSHTAEYRLGLPLLASYLDTGLAELDAVSAEDAAKRFTA